MAYASYPSVGMTSGTANAKGAYVQIVAATPFASSRLSLTLRSTGAANRFFLVDLATGAAGAETVLVGEIAVNADADFLVGVGGLIDVDLPAGVRLACRCQSVTASQALSLGVLLEDRPLTTLVSPVTYGSQLNSRGTQIDPGATVNTKGSYVQLHAGTLTRMDAVLLCVTVGQQGQTIAAFTQWQVDVATGAAGAETVVIPDIGFVANSATDTVRPGMLRLPVSIHAGSRLAVRCQCDRNTVNERLLCVTLIGMQELVTGAVAYVG